MQNTVPQFMGDRECLPKGVLFFIYENRILLAVIKARYAAAFTRECSKNNV